MNWYRTRYTPRLACMHTDICELSTCIQMQTDCICLIGITAWQCYVPVTATPEVAVVRCVCVCVYVCVCMCVYDCVCVCACVYARARKNNMI